MRTIDTNAEFCWKKNLWFEIGKTEVVNTLTSCSSNCILPFFKSCAKEGFDSQILEVLDQGNGSIVFSFLFFLTKSVFRILNVSLRTKCGRRYMYLTTKRFYQFLSCHSDSFITWSIENRSTCRPERRRQDTWPGVCRYCSVALSPSRGSQHRK